MGSRKLSSGCSFAFVACALLGMAACVSPRPGDQGSDATAATGLDEGDASPANEAINPVVDAADEGGQPDTALLADAVHATDAGPPSPDVGSADGPVDSTKVPVCGDTTIDPGEECDPPGSCPTSCPGRGCARFVLQGTASTCTARCVDAPAQTACAAGDGCCPAGCNAISDSDCTIVCGNGHKEGSETCDPLSSCPSGCPAVGCQRRRLINAGTCAAECVNDTIQTACQNGDGCCPSSCNNNNDSDCAVRCGNTAVETGESCDPVSACTSLQAGCTSDTNNVRTPSGDPAQCTFRCVSTLRACGTSDGQCPAGCTSTSDPDCKKAMGQACGGSNSECLSGQCANGFCCNEACTGGCHSCAAADTNGPNGTCLPVRAGSDPKNNCTAQPATSCLTDGSCDGSGQCRQYGPSTVCSAASCTANGTEQPAGHCSGPGVCNTPAKVACSSTCGAQLCGGSCAIEFPFYCLPIDTLPSPITQCQAHSEGRTCDGDPTDEACDPNITYLFVYKKRTAEFRYDLVKSVYYVCDWNEETPLDQRRWHEGS